MFFGNNDPVHPPAVPPKRDLPARLEPILLSTRAANLLHSVVHDAQQVGACDIRDSEENYRHLNHSRGKLVEYISKLEEQLRIPRHEFFKFD